MRLDIFVSGDELGDASLPVNFLSASSPVFTSYSGLIYYSNESGAYRYLLYVRLLHIPCRFGLSRDPLSKDRRSPTERFLLLTNLTT